MRKSQDYDEFVLKHGGRRELRSNHTHTWQEGGRFGFNKKYHTHGSVLSVMQANIFGEQGTKIFQLKSAYLSVSRLHVLDMNVCSQCRVKLKGMQ